MTSKYGVERRAEGDLHHRRREEQVAPSTPDAAAEPAPTPAVVQAWLGLFDFAPNGKAIVQWGPGS